MYFIDTNIFLRVLLKDNEGFFKECSKVLNLIRNDEIQAFTSTLVLSEMEWVLRGFYKFEKQKVIEGLEGIIKLKNLKVIDKFNFQLALDIFRKNNVKFIDTLLASNLKIFKKEVTIISYDKDFDKIGVKRIEPASL